MQPITLSANKNWKFFRGQPPKGFYDNNENFHNAGLDCFEIAYDVSAWETAYVGKASGQTRLPNRFANPVKARYLRIVILSVSGGDIPGIYHVEVFGKKA